MPARKNVGYGDMIRAKTNGSVPWLRNQKSALCMAISAGDSRTSESNSKVVLQRDKVLIEQLMTSAGRKKQGTQRAGGRRFLRSDRRQCVRQMPAVLR
jgi:hypothetical protein